MSYYKLEIQNELNPVEYEKLSSYLDIADRYDKITIKSKCNNCDMEFLKTMLQRKSFIFETNSDVDNNVFNITAVRI